MFVITAVVVTLIAFALTRIIWGISKQFYKW